MVSYLRDVGKAVKKHLSVAGPRFFFRFCRNTPNYISLAGFHQKRCAALDTLFPLWYIGISEATSFPK
jgi:hypothetical protein